MATPYVMRPLLFAILLISRPCSSRKTKIIDGEFIVEFFQSYFCTGDQDWWRNIKPEHAALGYMMHVGIITFCNPAQFVDKDMLGELVEEARLTVKKQTWDKRKTVTNCLWGGIKHWSLAPFFCPLPSTIFMKNYDLMLDSVIEKFCFGHEQFELLCQVAKWVLRERASIREIVRPHVCASHRLKRQFDVKSGMAIFEQIACLNSVDFNFNYVAMEKGNHLHFVYFGFWCCIMEFVET